ncbi:uncharacterized protein ACN427_006774 isoform 1-T2 [Glossina fuscipes fuscipes]
MKAIIAECRIPFLDIMQSIFSIIIVLCLCERYLKVEQEYRVLQDYIPGIIVIGKTMKDTITKWLILILRMVLAYQVKITRKNHPSKMFIIGLLVLVARCEHDGVFQTPNADHQFLSIKS